MTKTIAVWCALLCATSLCAMETTQLSNTNKFQQTNNSIPTEIENYINGLKCLSASFTETNSHDTEINKGYIYIKRECIDGKTSVRINYETGKILSVVLDGRFLTVTERKTNKSRTYSILTTPIYAILAGKLNLKKIQNEIIKITEQRVVVQVLYEKQIFDLTFQKNGNRIIKLLSWTIKNGDEWVNVDLDKKSYYENDLSKIPEEIFKKKK